MMDNLTRHIVAGIIQVVAQSRVQLDPAQLTIADAERCALFKLDLEQEPALEQEIQRALDSSSSTGVVVLEIFATNASSPDDSKFLLEVFSLHTAPPTADALATSPVLGEKLVNGVAVKQCAGIVSMLRSLQCVLRLLPAFSFSRSLHDGATHPAAAAIRIAAKVSTSQQCCSAPFGTARSTRIDMSPITSQLGRFTLSVQYRDVLDLDIASPLAVPPAQDPLVPAGDEDKVAQLNSSKVEAAAPQPDDTAATTTTTTTARPDNTTDFAPGLPAAPLPTTVTPQPVAQQTMLNLPLIRFLNHCETAHQYQLEMFKNTQLTSLSGLEQFMHNELSRPLGAIAS